MVSSNNMNASVSFHLCQGLVQMEGNNRLIGTVKGLKSVSELNGDTITHVSAEKRSSGWSNSTYSCLQGSGTAKPTEILGTLKKCRR